jgi:hypothetical protein
MELDFHESCLCDDEIERITRESEISVRLKGQVRSSGSRNWVLEGDANVMLRFLKDYQKMKCRDYDFSKL